MKNTRYFKLFTVIIFTLLSISCSFWNNPQNNKNKNDDKFILNGSINLDVSRSALPSIPNGEYFVSASDGSHEVTGSVENGTYLISLERNKAWTVTASLISADSADSQTLLMIDTWSIPQTNTAATLSHNFVLKPVTSENGTGSLDLTIILNNDLDGIVSKVTADCKSANTENWEVSVLPTEENMTFEEDSPLEVTVSQNTIASGQYEVSFNFYNANNILVYNTIQTINIFDNLTTDTWSSSGSVGPIKTDGSFELTKALVEGYSQTHLYVGATAFAATPSDTNANGSAAKPFATIAGAVSYLEAVGNSDEDYTIFISGTNQGTQNIPATLDGKIKSLTLTGLTGNNTDILNGTDNDSNTAATVLQIGTTKPVILRNLKITGGLNGISSSDVEIDLTISTGTLIKNNQSNSGLQIAAGTVTLDGGIISENTGTQGGGVNITGGTFIMTSGSISGNTVESNGNGSGVYVAAGATFKMGGSAVIAENNDVYLPSGAKITIIEDFDGDIACAALITPETYEENTSVIEAGGTNTLENEYKLFKVSTQLLNDDVPLAWKVTSAGQLDLAAKVGALLLSDGTYISYDENRTAFTAADFGEAKPVGIVYALNSDKTPAGILGIKNSDSQHYAWATESSTHFVDIQCKYSETKPESGTDYYAFPLSSSTIYITGDLDGSDNWNIIYNYEKTNDKTDEAIIENYPAFKYANTYGENEDLDGNYLNGWYIPSVAELHKIYKNKEVINNVLSAIDATDGYSAINFQTDKYYWSSSTYKKTKDHKYYSFSILWGNDVYGNFTTKERSDVGPVCVVHKIAN